MLSLESLVANMELIAGVLPDKDFACFSKAMCRTIFTNMTKKDRKQLLKDFTEVIKWKDSTKIMKVKRKAKNVKK